MGASSVTGVGNGASGKLTTKELASLANGPDILYTGVVSYYANSSPPVDSGVNGVVRFPQVLPGSPDNYVVLLTGMGEYVYLGDFIDDDDGNFVGFIVVAEDTADVMYMVAKKGQKPSI